MTEPINSEEPDYVNEWLCRYELGDLIARGGFACVYQVTDDTNQEYAAKKANLNVKEIKHEYQILQRLADVPGVPKVFWYGRVHQVQYLHLTLLGSSVSRLQNKQPEKKFPLHVVCSYGCQLLDILRQIHDRGIIHRDLSPANICVSQSSEDEVYLIDFGLATEYKHLDEKSSDNSAGTTIFMSKNSYSMARTRRDDVEALGYVLLLLYLGTLPWIPSPTEGNKREYCIKGKSEPVEKICSGAPPQFADFLTYCR